MYEEEKIICKLIATGQISQEFSDGYFIGYKDRSGAVFSDEKELKDLFR
jgi:hypothetical protein